MVEVLLWALHPSSPLHGQPLLGVTALHPLCSSGTFSIYLPTLLSLWASLTAQETLVGGWG